MHSMDNIKLYLLFGIIFKIISFSVAIKVLFTMGFSPNFVSNIK